MNKEEQDLALYKEYLDRFYGSYTIGGILGIKEQSLKASKIIEEFDPVGFEKGFHEYCLQIRDAYEPRN